MTSLIPLVRRVIAARVSDRATADDLVQETLTRVLAAAPRVEPGLLESYAIVTARNVVASLWREHDRHRRNQHRVVDLRVPDPPDSELLALEEQGAVARALAQLSERERELLLAHEGTGQDTRSLADAQGSTAGAVAAQLNRIRAHRSHSSRCRLASTSFCRRRSPPDNASRTGRHRSVDGSEFSSASRYSTRSRARVRFSWAATAPAVDPCSSASERVS